MAQPAAAVAPASPSTSLPGAAASALTLAVLAALTAWPLADVLVRGAVSPFPRLAIITGVSVIVAGAATLGALALGAVVGCAVRFAAPGAERLVAIHRVGVFVPPFVVPLGVLVLAGHARLRGEDGHATVMTLAVIALAQAFAYLPYAVALLLNALAAVAPEAEQAAELLGASRARVLRRITLGLVRSGLARAALIVFGLCLADVAAPLLLGLAGPAPTGLSTLASFIVITAGLASASGPDVAAAGALALSIVTLAVTLAARAWRFPTVALAPVRVPSAGLRPPGSARAALAMLAWLVTGSLLALWAVVPVASVVRGGWRFFALDPGTAFMSPVPALLRSAALGAGVALAGTALAVAVVSLAERRGSGGTAVLIALARVPVVVPAIVGGLGYLLAFGAAHARLLVLALCVATWELPLMARVAGNVLARSDQSRAQVALTLGAPPFTTWRRVVLPALTPAIVWLLCHGFATGVTALNAVAALAFGAPGVQLGVSRMLVLASAGAVDPAGVGAACAVATTLVALAGGATLLGRAVAGRESIRTLLA